MPNHTFPRWIIGTPDTLTNQSPGLIMLREVAQGLYVGNALCAPWARAAAVYQLARECPVLDARPALIARTHVEVNAGIAPRVCAAVAQFDAFHRARWGVLLQCGSGARAACLAYVLLRENDGLSHDEALALVSVPGRFSPHPVALESAVRWVQRRR